MTEWDKSHDHMSQEAWALWPSTCELTLSHGPLELWQNIIECIFGVSKKQFPILVKPIEYNLKTQAKLVQAVCVIHNFICIHDPEEVEDFEDEMEGDNEDEDDARGSGDPAAGILRGSVSSVEWDRASKLCNNIAKRMWKDYKNWGKTCRGEIYYNYDTI